MLQISEITLNDNYTNLCIGVAPPAADSSIIIMIISDSFLYHTFPLFPIHRSQVCT